MIEVLSAGALSSVQDLGRTGLRHLGVTACGAADNAALRVANLLVGNPENSAGLEFTLTGASLRFTRKTLVALRGGDFDPRVGGRSLPCDRPVLLRAGCVLTLGAARRGARAYLAVAGGIAVRPRLGSRSTDLGAGFGGRKGRALQRGDALPVGKAPRAYPHLVEALAESAIEFAATSWWMEPVPLDAPPSIAVLKVLEGSHAALLDAASRAALFNGEWQVSKDSNRMGVRLQGPPLTLTQSLDLVSEGVVPGTVQLPPGGQPIVLGVDAQTIGGYPRVAQLIGADLDRLAQLRPGTRVRLAVVTMDAARRAWLAREHQIARMAEAIRRVACAVRT